MKRPMPYTEAPPHPGPQPKFSWDDVNLLDRLAAQQAWDDARWKYTASIVVGREKRLTDAECAAEYWRAESFTSFYAANEDTGEQWVHSLDEKIAWHRFSTCPHALEVQE